MGAISNWIRKLRERFFCSSSRDSSAPPCYLQSLPQSVHLAPQGAYKQKASTARKPYFLQIGFDFGTAFSKCVIRDVASDKAWVFMPPNVCIPNLPFLIPSRLRLDHGAILPFARTENHYSAGQLSMFKLALHQAITGKPDGSLIKEFEDIKTRHNLDADLSAILEACIAAYLAFAFADIQAHIDQRYPDFGKSAKDSLFVNLAIPAAAADHAMISKAFGRTLNLGWKLRKSIDRLDGILLEDVLLRTMAFRSRPSTDECCYVYPEVSANVQGFVRSRTSSPGIFLFVDTGAGSVDASAFIFSRNEDELVAYLDAGVFPLGSAWIERRAAELSNCINAEDMERLRRLKEGNSHSPELEAARTQIRDELEKKIVQLLANVKMNRLHIKDQLLDVRLIFGGGGHAQNPYEMAVRNCFRSSIFRTQINPPTIGLPAPRELQLPQGTNQTWLPRLGVAYGLSFPSYELAPFILPRDLPDPPNPIKVWNNRSFEENYVSKEMC
jgi:hypothetical protein